MDYRDALARAICEKEGLGQCSLQPMSGGQTNALYRAGEEHVIRINLGAPGRLQREAALLGELQGLVRVPRVLAVGRCEGAEYQVQELVRGEPLHRLWRRLSPSRKEAIVAELASMLQRLHAGVRQGFGHIMSDERCESWFAFCEERFEAAFADTARLGLRLAPDLLCLAKNTFYAAAPALKDAEPHLIHGDLWLGNILVAEGRISAILDFEGAMQAPVDYELLRLEQFGLYPNDYAAEDDEVYCSADFGDFFHLLREHYPGLFAVPGLRERLVAYHLVDHLISYVSWAQERPEEAAREFPIYPVAKMANVLLDHGARMFYR